jgi:hypothetical protein
MPRAWLGQTQATSHVPGSARLRQLMGMKQLRHRIDCSIY